MTDEAKSAPAQAPKPSRMSKAERQAAEAAALKAYEDEVAERTARHEREAAEAKANEPAPAEEPAAHQNRMIALLDKDYVLVGRVTNPSDADWAAAAEETKFPNGFDNALHRYKLVNWAPEKWRWEPVHHTRDAGEENATASPSVVVPLARCVVALVSGSTPEDADLGRVVDFLKSFDAQG